MQRHIALHRNFDSSAPNSVEPTPQLPCGQQEAITVTANSNICYEYALAPIHVSSNADQGRPVSLVARRYQADHEKQSQNLTPFESGPLTHAKPRAACHGKAVSELLLVHQLTRIDSKGKRARGALRYQE